MKETKRSISALSVSSLFVSMQRFLHVLYTTEHYPVDGAFAWDTWLASLKFPNCR